MKIGMAISTTVIGLLLLVMARPAGSQNSPGIASIEEKDRIDATKEPAPNWHILDAKLWKKAEQQPIPGPKRYQLFKISRSGEPIGSAVVLLNVTAKTAELLSPPGNEPLNQQTFSDVKQAWGPGRTTSQSEYRKAYEGFRVPNDKAWKWFAETPTASFGRFELITSENYLIRVEAFFNRPTALPEDQSRLVKYRVLMLGKGSSEWTDI